MSSRSLPAAAPLPVPGLSPYAQKAHDHWQRYLPSAYSHIPALERAAFFTRIGDEIEERIIRLTRPLDHSQAVGEQAPRYLAALAGLMTAQHDGERQVLAELLPPPEASS